MRIFHFSDSHGYHDLLDIPSDVDAVICSGDCSNVRSPYENEHEVRGFVEWFSKIKVGYKIYVAGNHDTSIEKRLITRDYFATNGIIYLENESIEIDGIKFYGTPYTPYFQDWAFMKKRNKMQQVWDSVPNNTNVLIAHCAPKGMLDLRPSTQKKNQFELVGCESMRDMIYEKRIKYILFGHIHDNDICKNSGIYKCDGKTYSNGSIVKDREFGKLSSQGNIIDVRV